MKDRLNVAIIMVGIWLLLFGFVLAICLLTGIITPADAKEQYPGQYDSVDAPTRDWFKNQKSPKTGGLCCSEADGEMVEEDIRNGVYWIRSNKTIDNAKIYRLTTEWLEVPDEVVIKEPNQFGRAVAWYVFQNGRLQVRCFAPGSLL
jgi:hypothetical protein